MSDEPPSRPFHSELTLLAGDWEARLPGAGPIIEECMAAAYRAAPADRLPHAPAEASVALADDATVRGLNARYRGKDTATNVLAFAAREDDAPVVPDTPVVLGDVVLALETVLREAAAQDKPPADHLRHLCVHGLLHLLGFDHDDAHAAAEMEELEVRILAGLGVSDPYAAPAGAGDAA